MVQDLCGQQSVGTMVLSDQANVWLRSIFRAVLMLVSNLASSCAEHNSSLGIDCLLKGATLVLAATSEMVGA